MSEVHRDKFKEQEEEENRMMKELGGVDPIILHSAIPKYNDGKSSQVKLSKLIEK